MTAENEGLDFDLDALTTIFGEPTPLSNPSLLDYWFTYKRSDGQTVTLSFSGYERSAGVIVRSSEKTAPAAVRLERCDSINVLEPGRRTFEVLASESKARCFVALDGDSILSVDVR